MPLTRRQRQILDYIGSYIEEKGYSPSFEEIAGHLNVASLNGVYKHLRALEERGFIRRLSNQARSIQLRNPDDVSGLTLPVLGTIAAGQPIEAVADQEEISVPENFLGKGHHFGLRVSGDSMIDEQIRDGPHLRSRRQDQDPGRGARRSEALLTIRKKRRKTCVIK